MAVRLGSKTEDQASVGTRRSTRLRQKTSPYFPPKAQVKRTRRSKPETSIDSGQDESAEGWEVVRVHGVARSANFFGLIQELVSPNVFRLLVATCLLNQTKGRAAMPVFWVLLRRWPDEHALAQADLDELTALLQPLGLHNIRARRLIAMAQTMVEIPYDERNSFKSRDRTAPDTPIGVYPGVGRYAIDSWRIFICRGGAAVGLKGEKPKSPHDDEPIKVEVSVESDEQEPEWMKVTPLDKELRAYLVWRWAKEGHVWDPDLGVVSPCPSI